MEASTDAIFTVRNHPLMLIDYMVKDTIPNSLKELKLMIHVLNEIQMSYTRHRIANE